MENEIAKADLRQPEEIVIGERTLQGILDDHRKWLAYNEQGARANLSRADLSGAQNVISICPVGSRGDLLVAVLHDDAIMIKTGCFWGTLDEFAEQVQTTHGDSYHGRCYRAAIELIKTYFEQDKPLKELVA